MKPAMILSCRNKKLYSVLLCAMLLVFLGGCVTTQGESPARKPFDVRADDSPMPPPRAEARPESKQIAQSRPLLKMEAVEEILDEDLEIAPETAPTLAGETTKTAQQSLDEALDYFGAAQSFWQQGELPEAVDALDQAYSLMLEAQACDDPALLQQKDDLRILISRRLIEIFAARHTVATGNHNAIPLVHNDHVQAEINSFLGRERNFFLESYRRSGQFMPMIEAKIAEAGLPKELAWLPLIESGFKVRALSSARALGPWQFIASTGFKFGLQRNEYIDERMDPEKSTDAAIAYLKELHGMFGDWMTAIAAYNCGENRVLRLINSQRINYLDDFWDLYQRLPRETARYVPRFLATIAILNDPEKYGMDLPEPEAPVAYEKQTINRRLHLKQIADLANMDENLLASLNPELRHRITPSGEYVLNVPAGTDSSLLARLNSLPESAIPGPAVIDHRIRAGETLSVIARRYRVSVNDIRRANNMGNSNVIIAGRTLKIPTSGQAGPAPAVAATTSAPPSVHTVGRGDSLWNLARRYGTTVAAIQRENNLSSDKLSVGQTLKIPGARSVASASKTYVVKAGDNPYSIAQRHSMSLNRFLSINGFNRNSRIFPGQRVMVD
ncbi:MAG: LysM peptidoglycan-binding domain-containing protein [Desulfatibacillaceae bacterium]|nr:LysM peptidoglycan-binding domain-containing protein [Desulfatibacillaceae bacterium]